MKTNIYLVDYRINKYIKNYLENNKIRYIKTIKNENLYEEINGHPDIVACNICGYTVMEEQTYNKINIVNENIIIGKNKLTAKYPYDIAYNVISTNRYLIGKIDFVDENIKKIAKQNNLEFINVNQGYTKCSTISLPNDVFITSDKNIHDTLISKNLKSYYVYMNDIYLSERYNGFLGGCCSFIDDILVFFGSIEKAESSRYLKSILKENNINYININCDKLIDYGSMIKILM